MRTDPGCGRNRRALRGAWLLSALMVALAVSSCSWEQAYYATQTWQRNECARLPDAGERERCQSRNSASYDAYRREADDGKPK